MQVKVTTVDYAPYGKCVCIENSDAQVLVTVDVGPRVISYKRTDGENLFFNDVEGKNFADDPSIMEAFGQPRYNFKGGHRMWATPEHMPLSYVPDDKPVSWTALENGAEFVQDPQPKADWQFRLVVTLAESGTEVTVQQIITNLRDEQRFAGAWGISQMRKGGVLVCPLNHVPERTPLPDKLISFWPYNDMCDERFYFAKGAAKLRQDPEISVPFKFGTNCYAGWAAYVTGDDVFVKSFAWSDDESYPDYGCNFESYVDAGMLEVEALGGMRTIGLNESVSLTEKWQITDRNDEKIKAYIV